MIPAAIIYDWFEREAIPAFEGFFLPLLPWILISMVAPLVRYRLDKQLWLYNKKHHDTHKEPRFGKYRNAIVNCLLIVLLAGLCKMTFAPTIGVMVVSNVIMVIFAAVQVVKCLNAYLKIEDVGFRINVFKAFKKSSFGSVLEKDACAPSTNNESNNNEEKL